MNEQIDIFNDRYEHIGVVDKKTAHIKGLWHRSFVCMILNPKRKTIFLQTKVKDLYTFERPDYVDFTVGGHYKAGEEIADGIREMQEEVGLDISFDDLTPIGVRQTAHTITEEFIEYEFQHIFLYPTNKTIDEFNLGTVEVSGLIEINIQEGIDLLLGKKESIDALSVIFLNKKTTKQKLHLTTQQFVPSYLQKDMIFIKLLIAAKRFINNEPAEEIFV